MKRQKLTEPRGAEVVRSIDVARLAGVSRSAVSRAFTEGASVSMHTRRLVQEAAERLGYRPNAIARSLITNRSSLIGLLIADLKNPFYSSLLDTLCQKIQQADRATLLLSCEHAEDPDRLLSKLLSYQVEGVFMTAAVLSPFLARRCERLGKPIVVFNRYSEQDGISCVSCDHVASGRLVAEHLLGTGHRRIGLIGGPQSTASSRNREQGFLARLAEAGVEPYARDAGNYSHEGGLKAARRQLSLSPRPDAIFCTNDAMALAVLDVARIELGLSVPADLSVVGFDNTSASASAAYDLTTVDQNVDGLTSAGLAMLLNAIEQPSLDPCQVVVPGRLVVRSSTRVPCPGVQVRT